MKIDTKAIQEQIDSVVNLPYTDENGELISHHKELKVTVKVDRVMTSKLGIDYRDWGYGVRLNSSKIHTEGQLNEILGRVTSELGRL